MLLRASSLLRRSSINHRASRVSNLRNVMQNSIVSAGRDSCFDVNIDEDGDGKNTVSNMTVHRCSMIKKYNIETFFTPAKMQHRRAATTETQPVTQRSNNATNEPMPAETILNAMSRH